MSNLPSGWIEKVSKTTGKTYWSNKSTQETSRTRPIEAPLPSGWIEKISKDKSKGETFYYNKDTKERTWKRPIEVPLPSGWIEKVSERTGKPFWSNKSTQETSRTRPIAKVKEIPDKLENIQSAKNVEFWLEHSSMCRAKIDKDSFHAGTRVKIVYDRIMKRGYYTNPIFLQIKDKKIYMRDPKDRTETGLIPITPEELVPQIDNKDSLWYISLKSDDEGGHANLVLIRKGKLYRFDPHGPEIGGTDYKSSNLILNKFLKDISKLLGLKYVPTEQSCPSVKGLQKLATNISKQGLCNFWVMLVIEILIKNKEMTMNEVLRLFSDMDPTQLSNIIYNFWWEVKEEEEELKGGRFWIEN